MRVVPVILSLVLLLATVQGGMAQTSAPGTDAVPALPEAGGGDQPQGILVQTPTSPGNSAILTVEAEALFARSAWGKRVQAELEKRSAEVASENDRLADQFATEEQQLTELRATLSPEEFRARADEFDKRVVEVRRAREQAARALQDEIESERAAFFRAALPVLGQVMRERGASVVLDQRAIFVAAESADVTDLVIERLDSTIGAGPAASQSDGGGTP
ncbi:OmpH family outer membrane protein [Paracoccus ravus]|uniref:OmpH family outer membrane protein n=1 Tax=Paracoccus ravus TaxID=2447760 RepID=UPI001FD6EBF6|nr:OmpH family outer membrane protein [Paracoccus ravus]